MSQYQNQYTHVEFLEWIKKQLENIRVEYQKLGKFDFNRMTSSLWHKFKNKAEMGNIEKIMNALKVANDPDPKRQVGQKLVTIVRVLLALVDRDINLYDLDKHHTVYMAAVVLHELARYQNFPVRLSRQIKEVLNRRFNREFNALDLEPVSHSYMQLRASLKEPPQQAVVEHANILRVT